MNNELIKRILSSIILLPVILYIIIKGSFFFIFFLFFFFLISAYEWQKMKISKNIKILGFIYLFISFFTFFLIRNNFENNYWPFLVVILICIFTDMGGYIFGKIFKGPKLTKLSPKKTYAGVFGSYVLCVVLFFFLTRINIVNDKFYINFLIFILIVSSISQLGDLIISYFKRLSNLKDTGNIIPGHGGLLDRIDGMIFAFPLSYLFFLTDYFGVIV
jgi:phosphatidate cytidylyltransferase